MQEISDFKCPYIPKELIWQEAENFRAEFWPEDSLPVDIEAIVEKRLKLNIQPEHDLLSELDIDAYLRVWQLTQERSFRALAPLFVNRLVYQIK